VARTGIRAIHQVLPSLHVADASGAHTLHARDVLREAGYVSEIFVEHVDPPLEAEARRFDEIDAFARKGDTVVLYQLAVGSSLVEHLLRRPEPLFVNYHNLTPADFYWKWAPDWLDAVETGRQQLHQLAPRVSHAIAVSAFNEADLRAAGYRSTSVVAPFVGAARTEPGPEEAPASEVRESNGARKTLQSPSVERPVRPEAAVWLFVGKLLPHKAAHDLLKALVVYRAVYDPKATLIVVGAHPVATYERAVLEYARVLGIEGAVELTGAVSESELQEAYRSSDVFVCLSEHEGFCFPLLEAMQFELPIVAFEAGAVPDTLGSAGLLLKDKSPSVVAASVGRLLSDRSLRQKVVAAGRERLRAFELSETKKKFVSAVEGAIDRL
jgi:glycosyltransferase involved in cell wall biosynthesis